MKKSTLIILAVLVLNACAATTPQKQQSDVIGVIYENSHDHPRAP